MVRLALCGLFPVTAFALSSVVHEVALQVRDPASGSHHEVEASGASGRRLHHAHLLYGFLFDDWVVQMDSDKIPVELDGHTHIVVHDNGTVSHHNSQVLDSDGVNSISTCENLCTAVASCNAIIFYPDRKRIDSDGVKRDCFLFQGFNDCAMSNVRTNLQPEIVNGLTRRVRFVFAFSKMRTPCNRAKDALPGQTNLFTKSTTCAFFYHLDRALCSDGSQCSCANSASCSACCSAHGATIAKCPGAVPFMCSGAYGPTCQAVECATNTPQSCPIVTSVLPAYREACAEQDACSVGFRCMESYGVIGKVCTNPRYNRQCATVGATDGGYFCGHNKKWKPMPGSTCVDSSWNWPDAEGTIKCNLFTEGGDEFERMCNYYADGEDANGYAVTSSTACCACGGGTHQPAGAFIAVPVAPVTLRPGTCESSTVSITITLSGTNETVPWRDNRLNTAFDCSWYEQNPDMCNTYGREKYFEGFYARGACCACGEVVDEPIPIEEAICTVACSQHITYCEEFESDYEVITEDCTCKKCMQDVDVVDPTTGVMVKKNFTRSLLGRCFEAGSCYDEGTIRFCDNVDCTSGDKKYCRKTCQLGAACQPMCPGNHVDVKYDVKVAFTVTDMVSAFLQANSDPKTWLGCILDKNRAISPAACDATGDPNILNVALSRNNITTGRQLQDATQEVGIVTVQTRTKPSTLRTVNQIAYILSSDGYTPGAAAYPATTTIAGSTTIGEQHASGSGSTSSSYMVLLIIVAVLLSLLMCVFIMWFTCSRFQARDDDDDHTE